MKAICLASAMVLLLLIAVTFALRVSSTRHRARLLLITYVACLALLVAVWGITPDDCGLLPRALLTQPPWLDLALCIFFFSSAFFGGVLQLYNLADRGFSLRMLVDIMEQGGSLPGVEAVVDAYGGGHGIRWMYARRIAGLIENRLIDRSGPNVTLAEKGNRVAALFIAARRFLRLDPV